MALSDEQIDRYSRQILVPEIGGRGQERLLRSKIVGLGRSKAMEVALDYLSASGITVLVDAGPAPETAAPDAVLAVGDDSGVAELTGCADTPLIVLEETPGTAWYSRSTTTRHCLRCILERGRESAAGYGDPSTLSSAAIAGAALAVDVIFELLGLASPTEPSVIIFTAGGTARHDCKIDFSYCSHSAESARIAS